MDVTCRDGARRGQCSAMTSPGWRWLLAGLLLAVASTAAQNWINCETTPCVSLSQCVYETITCEEGKVLKQNATVCHCCPGCVEPGDDICTKTDKRVLWTPDCDAYGKFKAVQCKGTPSSGRCFCWTPEGQRIDGQRAWESASAMTCACSVRAWELTNEGRQHEAPRCTTDGSYEELQCSRGVCWCAESRTGVPVGRVVPEGAMSMLYCYNADDVGASYRRRCDSQLAAKARIMEVMDAHGTSAHSLPSVACDYDGSFAPVQERDNGANFCAWKDKLPIQDYQEDASVKLINCNCARDTIYLNSDMDCAANGNYRAYGNEGTNTYCLDEDGYFTQDVGTIDECYY